MARAANSGSSCIVKISTRSRRVGRADMLYKLKPVSILQRQIEDDELRLPIRVEFQPFLAPRLPR